MSGEKGEPEIEQPGLWLAYYSDGSSLVVFDREIDALRHAVEHSMQVRRVALGECLVQAARS